MNNEGQNLKQWLKSTKERMRKEEVENTNNESNIVRVSRKKKVTNRINIVGSKRKATTNISVVRKKRKSNKGKIVTMPKKEEEPEMQSLSDVIKEFLSQCKFLCGGSDSTIDNRARYLIRNIVCEYVGEFSYDRLNIDVEVLLHAEKQVKNGKPHPVVQKLIERKGYKQLSPAWFKIRKGKVTGSKVMPILNKSKYSSREEQFRKDTGQVRPFKGNFATQRGQRLEPVALEYFKKVTGIEVLGFDVGFVVHPKFDFIGASPDGVCRYINAIIEIKCPMAKKLTRKNLDNYFGQVQLQMEVMNIDLCYFVQFRPKQGFKGAQMDIMCVPRDKQWFASNVESFKSYSENVTQYYKSIEKPIGSKTRDWDADEKKEADEKAERKRIREERAMKRRKGKPRQKKIVEKARFFMTDSILEENGLEIPDVCF